MTNNDFWKLSDEERGELGQAIASGAVESDPENETDTFSIELSTGRHVVGAYRWGMEYGESIKLSIPE